MTETTQTVTTIPPDPYLGCLPTVPSPLYRSRDGSEVSLNMRLANTQALGAGPMEGEYIERGRSRERGRRGSNIDPNVKLLGQNGLPPPIAAGHRIRIKDVGEISQSWRD